ncbi:MAG: trypsin-like peptidase domain-containing protein [Deltaproteobacteria bacterium]
MLSSIVRPAVVFAFIFATRWAFADGPARRDATTIAGDAEQAYCPSEYADNFAALSASALELEQRHAPYTYCLRSTARYECPFYGDGAGLRRRTVSVVAHGTAFAYRARGKDTLLLTNEHVADWPAVTDSAHRADGVPDGCKQVSHSLTLVDSESDAFERDDLTLAKVVSDPQLDVAVLEAHACLPVIPWKIGHSAGLSARNAVHVRGFPLGMFKATNVGKVIAVYDHDDFGDWDHDDFVIDALLSAGNSGSPVLAISCKTGAFELVGIYHAGYTHGSALNVVIGIDQLREVMDTLTRKRKVGPVSAGRDFDARTVQSAIRDQAGGGFFFPFGSLVASVWNQSQGGLLFEIMNRDFPLQGHPVLVIEDVPSVRGDSAIGRVWWGGVHGLVPYVPSSSDAETRAHLTSIARALRRDSYLSAQYHLAVAVASSRAAFARSADLQKSLEKAMSSQRQLGQFALELAERNASAPGDVAVSFADVLSSPAPAQQSPAATGK